MTVAELIKVLGNYPSDMEVMVLDSHNGGGTPRTVNLGPNERTLSAENAEDAADCEDRVGERVVVLGYGCY